MKLGGWGDEEVGDISVKVQTSIGRGSNEGKERI